MKKTNAIIILDGYGLSDKTQGNAIKKAETPYLDYLFKAYPHSKLKASGLDVGLPDGQMGNSEVGHLNLGAGRVVYQDITTIDRAIESGEFFKNPAFLHAISNAKQNNKALHLVGLCSDGGVHSSLNHLFALIKTAAAHGLKNVFIHCITDGRDTPPQSAGGYIKAIEDECARVGAGRIATVVGRYYYMDRDNRWERVALGYKCVFEGEGERKESAGDAVLDSYKDGITDEFIKPCVVGGYAGAAIADSIIFFNFRADRARQITRAVLDKDFDSFPRKEFLQVCYAGMTQYDAAFDFENYYTAFPPKRITNTLGEVLAAAGLTQARIAETEKYAHVTFFFDGGVEAEKAGETRVLIPSPKVATYDLKPEMSAAEVAAAGAKTAGTVDALILNFAGCDMVGHTGELAATVAAAEAVDSALKTVVEAVLKSGGTAFILSDHGNAEEMVFEDGTPQTAHTTSLVPLIIAGEEYKSRQVSDGALCDAAPTFLGVCGVAVPKEMTGKNLIKQ